MLNVDAGSEIVRDSALLDTIQQMKVPTSPGFVLLENQPKVIQKPQTPKALGLVLGNALGQGGTLASDFALEVAPYWVKPHPSLSFDEYYNPSFWQSIAMNTCLTGAASPLKTNDSIVELGVGVKTILIDGFASKSMKRAQIVKHIHTAYNEYSGPSLFFRRFQDALIKSKSKEEFINTLVDMQKDTTNDSSALALGISVANDNISPEHFNADTAYQAVLNILEAMFQQDVKKLFDTCDQERKGFIMEGACAVVTDFADAKFKNSRFSKLGIWLTPMYSVNNSNHDFIGVVRYIFDDIQKVHNGDAGLCWYYSKGNYAFSVEYLGRLFAAKSEKLNFDWHLAVNGNLTISHDVTLSASLGKDFSKTSGKSDMVMSVDINFGAGKHPVLSFQ
jgi:hypothetical protein